jgi:hypothetical protein
MVANNPLFSGRWTLKKFNATVVNDIWPEVLFFTGVATGESPVRNFLAFRLLCRRCKPVTDTTELLGIQRWRL